MHRRGSIPVSMWFCAALLALIWVVQFFAMASPVGALPAYGASSTAKIAFYLVLFGFIPASLWLMHASLGLSRMNHSESHPRLWLFGGTFALIAINFAVLYWSSISY